jgi:GntR family transcriptional regulator
MAIDRNPSLTEQVMAHLKDRIRDGGFPDGRIPPETELAADLGVSRTTVRDALSRLEHEGVVVRRQGSGTYVNRPVLQIRSRLEEIWSYERMLEDHGYTPTVVVLAMETSAATPDDAAALGVEPGAPLLVVEKLFLEDDRPAVLTHNRIPQCLVADAPEPAAGRAPIYEFLEEHCGRRLSYYLSDIVPAALSGRVADALEATPGTPALCFEETGYDASGSPILRATSWFRDDLVRFRLMRRKVGG